MSNIYVPDPVDYFERMDYEQTKALENLPTCDSCGEPIQDNPYYEIECGGMPFKVCNSCLNHYKKWRED